MRGWVFDPQLFEDGAAGGGTGATAGGDAGTSADGTQVLADGTRVDSRLADLQEKQRRRHPERAQEHTVGAEVTEPQQRTPDEEWDELRKGRYKEQYSRDVQAAIQDRFKNQADANETLKQLKPMLDALAEKNGIEAGDFQALSEKILDDDSLYEDAAEEHGMTVEAYKAFRQLEMQAEETRAREAQTQQEIMFRQHIEDLARQGEALKQSFPNFDLREELQNETFRRLTAPNSGLTVEQAYYAVHHNEIAPQAMAYGIQRGKQQMAQSMNRNAARPSEGAMRSGAAANLSVDPRHMSREQREDIKNRVRMGEKITF